MRPSGSPRRVLIAGMGSILRRDDGFGVAVVQRLMAEWRPLPPGVTLLDAGTGGIAVVQELLDGYEALIVVDAVRRGGEPGTLYLLEPLVDDLRAWTDAERRAFLADTHYAEPSKIFTLAQALGVLPPFVRLLGCEPAEVDEADVGLTERVEQAVEPAAARVRRLVAELLDRRQVSDPAASPVPMCGLDAAGDG